MSDINFESDLCQWRGHTTCGSRHLLIESELRVKICLFGTSAVLPLIPGPPPQSTNLPPLPPLNDRLTGKAWPRWSAAG